MVIYIGASIFSSLPFGLLGAWPVAGFMGINVAIFYFAFRANFRAAAPTKMWNLLELMHAKVSVNCRPGCGWVGLLIQDLDESG
ncbi:MAG: DUF2244 domain-containing protein [Pseudomonadota bacterium]|nr:DUF2244 domain-containing protein [Pseudomonadota bacterium]